MILSEIRAVLEKLPLDGVEKLLKLMNGNTTLFLIGEGRSGFMAKSFAMRLFHLGLPVYAVGETIAPPLRQGDALIAVSGSGASAGVVSAAAKARETGAAVIGVTTNAESALAELANDLIVIPAATRYRQEGEAATLQPLGSLFDQCAHVVFDAVCLRYARSRELDPKAIFQRHTNL